MKSIKIRLCINEIECTMLWRVMKWQQIIKKGNWFCPGGGWGASFRLNGMGLWSPLSSTAAIFSVLLRGDLISFPERRTPPFSVEQWDQQGPLYLDYYLWFPMWSIFGVTKCFHFIQADWIKLNTESRVVRPCEKWSQLCALPCKLQLAVRNNTNLRY